MLSVIKNLKGKKQMKSFILTLVTFAISFTAFALPVQSAAQTSNQQATQIIEACFVKVVVVKGFTFHTAKYPDGTAVVTSLDGDLKGYQKISFSDGYTESFAVEWHQDYFVHYYQHGTVYSYPDRQILEIN